MTQFLTCPDIAHRDIDHLSTETDIRIAGVIDEHRHIFHVVSGAWRQVEFIVDLQRHIPGLLGGLLEFSARNDIAGLDGDNFIPGDIGNRDHATPGERILAHCDFG